MPPQTNADPFDDLLTLEDTLYTTARSQGIADGARAGRIEGRIFGLEKGFEKFSSLGEIHGRGAVWGSRVLPNPPMSTSPFSTTGLSPILKSDSAASKNLPSIESPSVRLHSNISLLYHLTDPSTFSTSNIETDVADFDDRYKRAGAKAKVIERIVGEATTSTTTSTSQASANKSAKAPERGNGNGNGKGRSVRLEGEGKRGGKRADDNMEDFGGSRLIR